MRFDFLSLLGDATFTRRHATDAETYLFEFAKGTKTLLMGWRIHGKSSLPDVGVIEKGWSVGGQEIGSQELTTSPSYYLLSDRVT